MFATLKTRIGKQQKHHVIYSATSLAIVFLPTFTGQRVLPFTWTPCRC